MQYNGHSTNQDIVSDITFLLGGIGTADYELADRARNVNERYRMVWSWIFDAYGGWIWDDSNQIDLPQATATLTSGQSTYALPTGAITVEGIEVKDTGGIWHAVTIVPAEQIQERMALDEFYKTDGIPRYARLVGDTIEFFPGPNYTQAASLKVYFSRDISTFASGDTTKTPGFAAPFHRALSVGAALDYAIARNMTEKARSLSKMWSNPNYAATKEDPGYEQLIRGFYQKRFEQRFPPLARNRDQVQDYI